MSGLLLKKLLRDMRSSSGRIALMIVAITLSLTVFSAMLYARTLVQSNMTSGYSTTNPASARITFAPGVAVSDTEDLRQRALREPGVIDATLRAVTSVKVRDAKGAEGPTQLQLFVAAADDPMKIATFQVEEGAWPAAAGSVLLERSALDILDAKSGGKITVTGFDGRAKQLTVAGVVRDQALSPAGESLTYAYATPETLAYLGGKPQLNQLAMTIADEPRGTEPSRDRDAIVAKATAIATDLKNERGLTIDQIAVPPPYEHPHQGIANTVLTTLTAFGGLALLLSAILIGTMFNGLLTQHIPQIGILKAIGARSGRVLRFYAAMILLVVAGATVLALGPGVLLGRGLAEMLLIGALNMEIASLSIPAWAYGMAISAGVAIPLLITLPPLIRASRRTVREALDEYGITEKPGPLITRFYAWLGKFRSADRILLMACRNVFRRRARFILSVSLLAVAGAIYVSGLNIMAGFQAIPKAITVQQRWDVQVRLAEQSDASQLIETASGVPGVKSAEAWSSAQAGIRYAGGFNTTRTYPDQGHGSLMLSALPDKTATLAPPRVLEGRWLRPGDTDAIVLPASIRKTLPDIQVGGKVELTTGERSSTWQVVGLVEELTGGGSCPCVSLAGFTAATGSGPAANTLRIITDEHSEEARAAVARAVTDELNAASLKVQTAQPIEAVLTSAEEHSNILIILIMLIALAIGAVGLIGLSSTMSTSVIERTREFGVMNAIGATGGTVRRLIVTEGVFIAVMSCVVAVIPALLLTILIGRGLGSLFFNAPLPFAIALEGIASWVVLLIVGTVVAALIPAYRAARLTVREALAYL